MPVTAKKKTTKATTAAKTKKATSTVKATATKAKKADSKDKKAASVTSKKATSAKTTKTTSVKAVKSPAKEKAPVKAAKKSSVKNQVLEQVAAEVKAEKSVKAPRAKKSTKVEEVATIAPASVVAVVTIPEKPDFVAGDFVVYPAHGVGQVEGIDIQHIGGMEVALYTISFEKDRMRLKLPVSKAKASGLRKLSSKERLKDALVTLQGRSQTRRIMWSRRAQEYETKINSGDPVSIAEVLRDLKKDDAQSEQSYSERQIYQAALERLAREVAAIEEIAEDQAVEKLEVVLSKIA